MPPRTMDNYNNDQGESGDCQRPEGRTIFTGERGRQRRTIDPTILPGITAIPRHMNKAFVGKLFRGGDYFAKSTNHLLGPFVELPSRDMLPPNEKFVIMQRVGIIPQTTRTIYKYAGQVDT